MGRRVVNEGEQPLLDRMHRAVGLPLKSEHRLRVRLGVVFARLGIALERELFAAVNGADDERMTLFLPLIALGCRRRAMPASPHRAIGRRQAIRRTLLCRPRGGAPATATGRALLPNIDGEGLRNFISALHLLAFFG